MPRAATCTPVDFVSDSHFWGRDTGLICQSLRAIGVDCECIMPGATAGQDEGGVLRASPESLASVEWWAARKLDFVVLYAWGDPKYLPIARAIRAAGTTLIQNLDSAGIESPYADAGRWWRCFRRMVAGPQPLISRLRRVGCLGRDLIPGIFETRRVEMLGEADVLAVVSPAAGESIRAYLCALGGGHLCPRIKVIPHPVPDFMAYDGREKKPVVISVGRWNREDWHQKNPALVLAVAREFCRRHPDWEFQIIGRGADGLSGHFPRPGGVGEPANLSFAPQLGREALRERYLSSSVLVCASRFESYHIASAEALCCGCRVVLPEHPLLSSTAWFAGSGSGRIADSHHPDHLLRELDDEVELHGTGGFEPGPSAARWKGVLTGKAVANTIVTHAEAAGHGDRCPHG